MRSRSTFELLETRRLLTCDNPADTCIALIGDYGVDTPDEAAVAELVRSWDPEAIVTLGDNNYTSGEAATIDANIGKYYHDYIFPYRGVYGAGADVNRFFPALGNIDWRAPGDLPQPYLDYFTLPGNERYYTFSVGPMDFFMLDSDSEEPDGITSTSLQADWLREALAASTAPWKLVVLHHPPYTSGEHGSYTDLQWPFQEWGASAVLSGHDHLYERIDRGGTPYFISGLGGAPRNVFTSVVSGSQVRYLDDFGAMYVQAGLERLTLQFINVAGEVIDTYTLLPLPHPIMVTEVSMNTLEIDPTNLPSGPQPANWTLQHSRLHSISATFNSAVMAGANDIRLTNLGINAPFDNDFQILLDDDQIEIVDNQLTISFAADALDDGVYELSFLPSLTNSAGGGLDGNGDGVPGDAYLLTGSPVNKFYQLTGDWNGDGGVSIFDFGVFSYWFGQSAQRAPAYVDLNHDGGISIFDFPSFSRNFGIGIAFPTSARASQGGSSAGEAMHEEAARLLPRARQRLLAAEQGPRLEEHALVDLALPAVIAEWNLPTSRPRRAQPFDRL